MNSDYLTMAKRSWQIWGDRTFRYKLVVSFFILVCILAFLPFFFQFIEHRNGHRINDQVLNWLKPSDVSIPVFLLIWSNALLILLSFIKNAQILLDFIVAYIILTLFRFLSIYFVALDPPIGLIPLKDPLAHSFYGATFITKDLFFSGHTSTLFLIFLCLDKRKFKIFSLIGTCIVGFLLLLQHVHYTIDIIFAFPFAYISYIIAKKII